MSMPTILEVPDIGPVTLAISKRAKHLRITIKPDRTVRLTVPGGVADKKFQDSVDQEAPAQV
jgi:predicted metal-dependent hydrolase